jgi:DNA polymerase-3 subunit epsilon/exodeoxyribonuclease X
MAKYILFDTETTGNAQEDRIIQLGGMIIYNKSQIECFDELFSSEVPIKLEAMEVHNITPELIAGKPTFDQSKFYQKILELNDSSNYLIAHNIKFDLGMLQKEGFENNFTLIDTLRVSRHIYKDLPYHRLQYLRYALKLYLKEEVEAKKLNITIKAHDAIGDVLVMKLLLSDLTKKLQELYPNKNPIDMMVELTNTPVMIQEFKFGKYKGQKIADVAMQDIGYLQWMLNSMQDLDEDLKYTINQYL